MPRFVRNTESLDVAEENYRRFRSLVPDVITDFDQRRDAAIEAARIYERELKRGSRDAAEQAAKDWLMELQEQVGAQPDMGR